MKEKKKQKKKKQKKKNKKNAKYDARINSLSEMVKASCFFFLLFLPLKWQVGALKNI